METAETVETVEMMEKVEKVETVDTAARGQEGTSCEGVGGECNRHACVYVPGGGE